EPDIHLGAGWNISQRSPRVALAKKKKRGCSSSIRRRLRAWSLNARMPRTPPGRSGSHLKFKFTATCSARVRTVNKKRSVGLELLDQNGGWVEIGNVSVPVSHEVPKIGCLVEVRYLYATAGRQLYQPVYLRLRTDLGEKECRLEQLKFKKDEEDA